MGCCSWAKDLLTFTVTGGVSGSWVESGLDFLEDLVDWYVDLHKDALEGFFRILGITDETVYGVDVHTQRLIPDEQDDVIKKIILNHAIKNSNIAESLLKNNVVGVFASMQKYLAYGDLNYTYATPDGSLWYTEKRQDAVQTVLDTLAGETVLITYLKLNTVTPTRKIKWDLVNNGSINYLYDTNEATTGGEVYDYRGYSTDINGDYEPDVSRDEQQLTTVYLETRVETIGPTEFTEREEYTEITEPSTGHTVSTIYTGSIEYTDQPDQGNPDSTTAVVLTTEWNTVNYPLTLPVVTQVDLEAKYFVVEYELVSAPGIKYLFVYEQGLGTYPTLDSLKAYAPDTTQLLPIVPLRMNFTNINDNPTEPAYVTGKELLSKIGLDMDGYIASLVGTPENPNTDLDVIEDAVIMFAVNVYTQSQGGLNYLYTMFDTINEDPDITKAEFESHPAGSNSPTNLFTIKEQSFNTALQWNWIDRTLSNVGVIAPVGQYASEIVILPNSAIVPADDENDIEAYGNEPMSQLILRYQDDASTYTEITVSGLTLMTSILTTAGKAKLDYMVLEDVNGADRNNFVIPLSFAFAEELTIQEEEELFYESLVMTIYASDDLYLRYYETQGFANLIGGLLKFLAIVILVLSLGEAASISEGLWIIAEGLFYQFTLSYTLGKILEHNLSPAVRALAISAYAYASYVNLSGNFAADLLPAQEFLLGVSAVTQGVLIDTAIQFEHLQAEQLAFDALREKQDKILEDAFEALEGEELVDPLDVVRMFRTDFYETPDEFFERTIHKTNPGVTTLEQIENYVDRKLELPQLT